MSNIEAKAVLDELTKTVAEFQTTVTTELEGKADVVVAEKVDRMNASIDDLQDQLKDTATKVEALKLNAANGNGKTLKDPEYSDAFLAHFKTGDIRADLNRGTDSEGGYLAPIEWDRTITDQLEQVSPIRQISRVQSISSTGFTKLFNMRGTASGWVGETAARPNTATATFQPLTFETGEIYANPAATQKILDDAEVDPEGWLGGEVNLEFAKQENIGFISGDGVNKPFGFLTYVTGAANAAKHPFGAIELINSGAAAAVTADGIQSLVYALPSERVGNARFVMNRNTHRDIRLLKDGQGNFLWQPSYQAGEPATLAGYPLMEAAHMPDVAANADAIAFGDFNEGYLVVDRIGVRVLRDPYTDKPNVSFYTTKRVGGGVLNPEYLKVQRIAA